jgi:DNA-binding response OmpR family regulator
VNVEMEHTSSLVLLVDDDPHVLDFISEVLEGDGFLCHRESSGIQVIELLREQPFKLVVLDLLMPRMDGWQVLEAMQREKLTDRIPVLIVSAVPSETSRRKALDLGARDYILKPFSVDRFQRAVRGALRAAGRAPAREDAS